MKKIAVIALVLISWAGGIFANEKISRILERYTSSPVEIDFEQRTYWAVRERENRVKGKIILAPGNKFNISVGRMNYVCDGETYWEFNNRQRQVVVRQVSEGVSSSLPTELLKLLQGADFSEKSEGFAVWQDEYSLRYGFERVEIHYGNSLISRIVITDTDKNITTYIFERAVFLPSVDESIFNFVIPSGAQVHER